MTSTTQLALVAWAEAVSVSAVESNPGRQVAVSTRFAALCDALLDEPVATERVDIPASAILKPEDLKS